MDFKAIIKPIFIDNNWQYQLKIYSCNEKEELLVDTLVNPLEVDIDKEIENIINEFHNLKYKEPIIKFISLSRGED